MKTLDGLRRWPASWVTNVGCLKGCLDYLDLGVSDAWLFGASGHAFVLNVHEVLCPSGPTAWNSERFWRLAENAGCRFEGVNAHKSQPDFAEKQERAWDLVRRSIDEGAPCYGWELDIPEFYVIYGYDDVGYYFGGPGHDDGAGPKPWRELADTGIGWLNVHAVRPAEPADLRTTIHDALEFAVAWGKTPCPYSHEPYFAGPAGYDKWAESLESGNADGFGASYNAQVWAECRNAAHRFFLEAAEKAERHARPPLDGAAGIYQMVAEDLESVAQAFPFKNTSDEQKNENVKDEERCRKAAAALRAARDAETDALALLNKTLETF